MDYYQELLKALGTVDDVEYLFRTQRPKDPKYAGSFYAQHTGNTTTGLREPSDRPNTGHEKQPKSYRTLFLDRKATDRVASWFQDKNLAVYAMPEVDKDGNPTGHLLIKSSEKQPYGPRAVLEKDQILSRVPYSKKPIVGYSPVEFGPSASSPRGSEGDAHFGNEITEVHPRSAFRNIAGKAGLAAALLGGAGAANAGEYRRAAADVAESLLPLGMTPSTLAPGTLPPEVRAAQDAEYRARQQQQQQARMKAQALLRSGVPMPEEYRQGGRVRMI
jgi:hypothetical protein